jgi:multisubunit Na+/H+ antiporter MnhC subunit
MKSGSVSPELPAMRPNFARIVLGMAAADIAIVVVGVLEAGRLTPCRPYPGEGTESSIFVVMVVAILVATAVVVALARQTTRSWAIAMAILCVQLSTSTGFAFLPFIVRLSPAGCSG